MATLVNQDIQEKHRLVVMRGWQPIDGNRNSMYLAISHANDVEPTSNFDNIHEQPMLVQNNIELKSGQTYQSFDLLHGEEAWKTIYDHANTDGDKPVFNALYAKDKAGENRVDISSVERADKPFDAELHKSNTLDKRAYLAQSKATGITAQTDKQQDAELER